jgi:DNA-binding GntR family transcriptional regulator
MFAVTMMDLRVSVQLVRVQAVSKMRDAILSGFFVPGERLIETKICSRLGISRSSLREALRCLEAEKLVKIVPNKGSTVPLLTLDGAREIYNVKGLLEGEAAALFTQRASAEQLDNVRDALFEFETAAELADMQRLIETERLFFRRIIAGCANQIVEEVWEKTATRLISLPAKSFSIKSRPRDSALEKRAILQAIVAQDADAARKASVAHALHGGEAAMLAYATYLKSRRAEA